MASMLGAWPRLSFLPAVPGFLLPRPPSDGEAVPGPMLETGFSLSPSVLSEDQDSYLCNVTLFRKAVDDFRHKAREHK